MRELKKSTEEAVAPRRRRSGGPHISLERRHHPRLPAVDFRVWVGGWATDVEFVTIAARVENLSRGGARVVSWVPFATGEDVWLRLGSREYMGCVRGEVLEASPNGDGDHLLRIRFHEPCPDPFYEIVTEDVSGDPDEA